MSAQERPRNSEDRKVRERWDLAIRAITREAGTFVDLYKRRGSAPPKTRLRPSPQPSGFPTAFGPAPNPTPGPDPGLPRVLGLAPSGPAPLCHPHGLAPPRHCARF